ncbi:hypothetical protein [Shimia sp.]|uniref:hypothetical protein n=1 Tax=Shimia sp. TaxID=1954381 RepID=UPI003B8CC37A
MKTDGSYKVYEIEFLKKGAPVLSKLTARGYGVELVGDYSRIEEMTSKVGRLATTPMMDVDRLDFEIGEAFWMFLTKENHPVASVSAKLIDLKSETLGTYTRRTTRGQYGRREDPLEYLDPMFDLIRGQVVYTGQIQTAEKKVGQANVGMSELVSFLRVTQLVILNRWMFDWMFGFVDEKHLALNRLYGFSCFARQAMLWQSPAPEGRSDSHALLASSRRQVELLFG